MGGRIGGMGGGVDPKMVEKLIQVERQPIETAKKRREKVVEEKKEVDKLSKMINELDTATNGLKAKTDFYKLKVESSHPDIIEGQISGIAQLGSYEFEVRGLARTSKQLAYGFPDKDKTAVGFGYMQIERDDKEPAELVVEPGSTLEDVAKKINDLSAGVRATVINTKYAPDSYRLLVVSEKSGAEAKIHIDEDTTFLEFKEQVAGRNLDVLFEDVPVTDDKNNLDELVEGVKFVCKRAEPGTRVQLSINFDTDKTVEGIKGFVDKYNEIIKFANDQSKSPLDGDPGKLSGDSSVKSIARGLQQALFPMAGQQTKFKTLAEIGITSNPKTGELVLDQAKVRAALTDDYDAVAQLFIHSNSGEGVGERVSARLKGFKDPTSGVVKTRMNGLDATIKSQDKEIARKEGQLVDKEEELKRRFAALDSQLNSMNAQSSFLNQRFDGG